MSLRPHPLEPIPEETVRVAQAAFPHGHPYCPPGRARPHFPG